MIVEGVCAILAPFKFVRKIMEGEKHVTVSLIPGKIHTKVLYLNCHTLVPRNILLLFITFCTLQA